MWEVSAREAQYRDTEQQVVVDDPVVEVFLEDGRAVALRGANGRVFLEGKELQRVELAGVDPHRRELSEPGIDPVQHLPARQRVLHDRAAPPERRERFALELDPDSGLPRHAHHVGDREGAAVEN